MPSDLSAPPSKSIGCARGPHKTMRGRRLRKPGYFVTCKISAQAAVIASVTDFGSFASDRDRALASRAHCNAILTRKGRTSVLPVSSTYIAFGNSQILISHGALCSWPSLQRSPQIFICSFLDSFTTLQWLRFVIFAYRVRACDVSCAEASAAKEFFILRSMYD